MTRALTVTEVAIATGVSRETVYAWFQKGLPSIKLGRLRRVRSEALDDWLTQHTVPNTMMEAPVA